MCVCEGSGGEGRPYQRPRARKCAGECIAHSTVGREGVEKSRGMKTVSKKFQFSSWLLSAGFYFFWPWWVCVLLKSD